MKPVILCSAVILSAAKNPRAATCGFFAALRMTGTLVLRSPWFQLTCHILGEPGPAIGINIDAYADAMQRRAEEVDAMPASQWFLFHALLYGVDIGPGRIGWSGEADIFATVARPREAFISDTLAGRAAIGTVVA